MPRCSWCPIAATLPCHGDMAIAVCNLVNPDHPKYDPAYVDVVGRFAEPEVEPEYPSIRQQAANAMSAAGRAIVAVATCQPVRVPEAEHERRHSLCRSNTCGQYDAAQDRCRKCGCVANFKARLATENCPLDPPVW